MLEKKYDRFVAQVREEIKELYLLYNFFFAIESALVGAVFTGKLAGQYHVYALWAGLLLSVYWFWILWKQKLWRDNWMERIGQIETDLYYLREDKMFPRDHSSLYAFLFQRNGLWLGLFILPFGFGTLWLHLIFRGCYTPHVIVTGVLILFWRIYKKLNIKGRDQLS